MGRAEKVLLLGALYLAQGLPYGFFTQALPVLMRDAGYSLLQISALGLLFWPWAAKFLWAPWVDSVGTRRRWLLGLQLAGAAAALGLAGLGLGSPWLLVGVAVVNLVSATQDIATDGLAVTLLGPRERGLGNGLQVGAYRLGMVLGGGALLGLYAAVGWRTTFLVMAALLLLTVVPVLRLREPDREPAADPEALGARARWRGLAGWWVRLRQPGFLGLVALLVAFKVGDSMGSALVGPYLRDAGMSVERIALLKGTVASVTVLLGAAVGAWLVRRAGRRRALVVGGVVQAAAMALLLASTWDHAPGGGVLLVAACVGEAVVGGLATVALFTVMMDACDPAHAGTDYTLLACAVVVAQGLAALLGGAVGDLAGYRALFGCALALAVVGPAAVVRALDRGAGPPRLRPVWAAAAGGPAATPPAGVSAPSA